MSRSRFALTVAAASLGIAVIVVLGLSAVPVARAAVAGGLASAGFRGPWHGGHAWGSGGEWLPELAGLQDLPLDERFEHFTGAQVSLTDKDGKPLMLYATPGTVTASSSTSLSIAANDSSGKTFVIDSSTAMHGTAPRAGGNSALPSTGDKAVVLTVDGSATARAVFVLGAGGFGPWGR